MSNFTDSYSFNINPQLEGEFIFLDEEERRRFAVNDHDYLITQSRITDKNGIAITNNSEETMAKLVPAFNPVSFVTWVIKRDDLIRVNDWNNYTNWVYEDVPPYSYENELKEIKYANGDIFYNKNVTEHRNNFKTSMLKRDILTEVKIEFDGIARIDKNAEYFSKQQVYQHFKTNPKSSIYVYSYSIS